MTPTSAEPASPVSSVTLASARAAFETATLAATASDRAIAHAVDVVKARQDMLASTLVGLGTVEHAARTAQAHRVLADRQVGHVARDMYMSGTGASPADLLVVAPGQQWAAAVATSGYLRSIQDASMVDVQRADTEDRQAQQAVRGARVVMRVTALGVAAALEESLRQRALAAPVEAARQQAQDDYQQALMTRVPVTGAPVREIEQCENPLARTLFFAGFRGERLRQAWAIAMRESGGRADAISDTHDFGLFQFNRATYQRQFWWSDTRLLNRKYNAFVAFQVSRGGTTWVPWGLDGQGRPRPDVYLRAGWTLQQVQDRIVDPFLSWYAQFPCLA